MERAVEELAGKTVDEAQQMSLYNRQKAETKIEITRSDQRIKKAMKLEIDSKIAV